eukprot:TRINITY_DN9752_c0_g1_i1.p1 TRINITY_DN9752_c0_g1~~TRINITY_DN9752_c0_g1_i1.p1  ORF type:complete len:129 (+),score=24.59 TRINITY_DN9752_c0_g1_i1:324-710(+)
MRKISLELKAYQRIRPSGSDVTYDNDKHPFKHQGSYFRGVVLLVDLTNRKSLDVLEQWKKDIEFFAPANLKAIVVGNKCDDKKEMKGDEAKNWATKNGLPYYEVSAMSGKGIDDAMRALGTSMHETDF